MTEDVAPTKRKPLTRAEAIAAFSYDPESGILTRRRTGQRAGSLDSHGHRQVSIGRRSYLAHRVIWLIMTGAWPTKHIDHRDGDRDGNRWNNLREATRSENNSNAKRRSDNTVGLKGVSRHGRRFRAQIQAQGKKELIGVYATPEQAHTAYLSRAAELHGEFARAE